MPSPSFGDFRRLLAVMTEEQRQDFVRDVVDTADGQTAALFERWRLRLLAGGDGREAVERASLSDLPQVRPSRRPGMPDGPMRGFLT